MIDICAKAFHELAKCIQLKCMIHHYHNCFTLLLELMNTTKMFSLSMYTHLLGQQNLLWQKLLYLIVATKQWHLQKLQYIKPVVLPKRMISSRIFFNMTVTLYTLGNKIKYIVV